jgi:hypothetical protein
MADVGYNNIMSEKLNNIHLAQKFLSNHWPDLSERIPYYIKLCEKTEGTVEIYLRNKEIRGVGLFTIGTPENNYIDHKNGYILLLHTKTNGLVTPFAEIMYKISYYALKRNCEFIMFKGCIEQSENIKLYKKFANPIQFCTNLSGEKCILFCNDTLSINNFFLRYMGAKYGKCNNRSNDNRLCYFGSSGSYSFNSQNC